MNDWRGSPFHLCKVSFKGYWYLSDSELCLSKMKIRISLNKIGVIGCDQLQILLLSSYYNNHDPIISTT